MGKESLCSRKSTTLKVTEATKSFNTTNIRSTELSRNFIKKPGLRAQSEHTPALIFMSLAKLLRALQLIIKSLRLEKTSKIIKSNCQPSTTMPAKPYLKCHIYTFFEHLQGWGLNHPPGNLFQCLTTLSVKVFFLMSSLNLPWRNSRPLPLILFTSYLGEETNTCLATPSFQAVVESDKVSPQPPLPQTKQPQFPQMLLIRLVL